MELLRLLSNHIEVNDILVSTNDTNRNKTLHILKSFSNKQNIFAVDSDNEKFNECDIVFFATPHGIAMKKARSLINHGVKVIDLSADFRLKNSKDYNKWYENQHSEQSLLEEATYGLPELHRDQIKTSRIVAMPGCYPTAVILGFYPLLKANLINTEKPAILLTIDKYSVTRDGEPS